MRKGRILIVDDEPQILKILTRLLSKLDCDITTAKSGEEALELMGKDQFDLMLLDLKLPGLSGIEVLKEVKWKIPATSVVVITAYGSVDTAIQAMKLGADDFLQKPFDLEQLGMVVRRALERSNIFKEAADKKALKALEFELVGNSSAISEVKHMIERVARVKSTVIITGETGTGKEMVARLIHQYSDRSSKPLIIVNCAAIPGTLLESQFFGYVKGAFTDAQENRAGFFEDADGGVVFLDEIGELDQSLQAKILRILQEGQVTRVGSTKPLPVDVRVIAATNRNLRQMVEDRTFRQDLYYRLSVLPINVPPLREHREDLPLLINHILARLHKATGHKIAGVSPEFLKILQHYDFPGNIRELENIIEHSVLLTTGAVLTPETLPPEVMDKVSSARLSEKIAGEGMTLKQARDLVMEQVESRLIKQVLDECRDNFSLAARKLGISRSALYYKMKKYKLE